MLIFHIYAIRAILSAVIVCTSLVAPPILLLQTRRQLRLTGFPAKAVSDDLVVNPVPKDNIQQVDLDLLEKTSLSHSLLETAFLPNDGFYGIKIPLVVDIVNGSVSHNYSSSGFQQSPTLILSDILLTTGDWSSYPLEFSFDESLVCPIISKTLDSNFSESETINNLFVAVNLSPVMFIPQPSATTPLALYSPKQQFSILAFLKWLRLYIRELILNSLPKAVSEWMVNNRITLGVICVSVMYGSLLTPLLYYLWAQVSAKNKFARDLKAAKSTQLFLDMEMSKLREENHTVTGNLSRTKDLVTLLEQEVSKMKLKLKEMQRSKNMAEIKLDCMASDLQNMECEVERMEEEETEHRNILEKLVSEKSELFQLINEQNKDNFALCQQLDKMTNENTSLIENLSSLQEQLKQIKMELVTARQQMQNIQEGLESRNTQIVEQDKEIAELTECLSDVTHQTAQLATQYTDHFNNDAPTENLISDVQAVLGQIEETLEVDCEESKEDSEILNMVTILEHLSDENNVLRQENAAIKAKISEAHDELTRAQLSYKGVIEYLSSKEDTLHQELYNREMQWKEMEKLETQAREQLQRRSEELKREREEWAVTRNGLEELLRSLNSQMYINQDRAQRALEFVNTTEQQLRLADCEIMTLKQTALRLSQKRPIQQSRRLDTTRKPPVNSHHSPKPPTSLVRVTNRPVVNGDLSTSSLPSMTKRVSQTHTQDQTLTATLIRCEKLSDVFTPFLGWSTEPNQLLPEKSQELSNQLEANSNQPRQVTYSNQQVTYSDQQVLTNSYQRVTNSDQEVTYSDPQVINNDQQIMTHSDQQIPDIQLVTNNSNRDQEKGSPVDRDDVDIDSSDQHKESSDTTKTDSIETRTVNETNEGIATVEAISCSLSTGLTAESAPNDITPEVNASTSKDDYDTMGSKIAMKRSKYVPRHSSPLLFASKSQSSSQPASDDVVHSNVSTEKKINSLIVPSHHTQDFKDINQELDYSSDDSEVSVASEDAHSLGAAWNYTKTHNVSDIEFNGDSDSYYDVV